MGFGTGFWDHVVLEATHWSFDADDVEDRDPDAEEHWCQSMNTEIQKNFVHVTQNFSCVFIDSWARKGRHVNDTDEQEAFQRETQKLWTMTKQFGPFEFKTLEDVLADLYQCREERDCLDGVIAGDLKTVKEEMTVIWTHVIDDENMLEKHALRMETIEDTNTKQEGKLSEHSLRMDGIAKNDTIQDEKLSEHSLRMDDIAKNDTNQDGLITGLRTDVDGLGTDVEGLTMAPIGTIVAWSPKPNKAFPGKLESLPDGWVECDGKPISEGIWDGFATPDLNSYGHFLRGAAHYDDVLEEQAGQVEKHLHGFTEQAHQHEYNTEHSHAYTEHVHSHSYKEHAHSHSYTEHAHSHSFTDRVYKGSKFDDDSDGGNVCKRFESAETGQNGDWLEYGSPVLSNSGGKDLICKGNFTTDPGHDATSHDTDDGHNATLHTTYSDHNATSHTTDDGHNATSHITEPGHDATSHTTDPAGGTKLKTSSAGSGSYNTTETGTGDETVPINVKVIYVMKIK